MRDTTLILKPIITFNKPLQNISLVWRVGLHISPCCRLGRLQLFVWRLKLKTTVLCVQLAAEQGTYCVLTEIRPTVCINRFHHCKDPLTLCVAVWEGQQWQHNTVNSTQGGKPMPVLVLPFPVPSSWSNAKMRIAYTAKPSHFCWSRADRWPTLEETEAYFFFEVERCTCRLRIRFRLRWRHVDPRDCSHPIKMPVTLFGCIGEK